MENNRKERAKATKEQALRLDYLMAEMKNLEKSYNADSEAQYMKLGQEYAKLMSDYDWLDEEFEENGKKGLKNVKDEIVVPAIYEEFCMREPYFLKSKSVGAKFNGQFGLVERDGKGTPITEFEYQYIEPIIFTHLYAVWKKEDEKHFALMCDGKVITPYEIEDYGMPCDGAVLLCANGKKGLILFEQYEPMYIKPEYDDIYDDGCGSEFTFIKDGAPGRVTLDGKFISDDEFNSMSEEEQDDLHDAGFISATDI